jgi:hypothetical protein
MRARHTEAKDSNNAPLRSGISGRSHCKEIETQIAKSRGQCLLEDFIQIRDQQCACREIRNIM